MRLFSFDRWLCQALIILSYPHNQWELSELRLYHKVQFMKSSCIIFIKYVILPRTPSNGFMIVIVDFTIGLMPGWRETS